MSIDWRSLGPKFYVLGGPDGHTPVPVKGAVEWGTWFESTCRSNGLDARRVAFTDLFTGGNVSTVFLGLDHSFWGGPPILFETMSFGTGDEVQERYATWDEALAGHARIVHELSARKVAGGK